MRKSRDGENTKEMVLAAAKAEFAAHGYSGTSLAMIASRSGISDGLILHHFKTKKNLYHLVMEDLSRGYAEMLAASTGQQNQLADGAMQMMESVFNFWSQDSTYNRISLWAYLENQPDIAAEEARLTANLAGMISQLQAKGAINQEYSPFVLLTLTIGPIHFWVRYRDQFKESLNLSESMDELNEKFIQQFIQIIMGTFSINKNKREKEK